MIWTLQRWNEISPVQLCYIKMFLDAYYITFYLNVWQINWQAKYYYKDIGYSGQNEIEKYLLIEHLKNSHTFVSDNLKEEFC